MRGSSASIRTLSSRYHEFGSRARDCGPGLVIRCKSGHTIEASAPVVISRADAKREKSNPPRTAPKVDRQIAFQVSNETIIPFKRHRHSTWLIVGRLPVHYPGVFTRYKCGEYGALFMNNVGSVSDRLSRDKGRKDSNWKLVTSTIGD